MKRLAGVGFEIELGTQKWKGNTADFPIIPISIKSMEMLNIIDESMTTLLLNKAVML